MRPLGGASWGGGRHVRGGKRRRARGRIIAARTPCHGRRRGRQGRKGEVNCEHQDGREFTANGRKKRKMSQDFLSSGMARAHGYGSIFATHAVRGRPRVFEHLLRNAPFVVDRSRVLTVPVSFSSWGDGSSAMGRRALGAVIGVVVAAGESPLAWREQGGRGGVLGHDIRGDLASVCLATEGTPL